jgi:hypothetical protein
LPVKSDGAYWIERDELQWEETGEEKGSRGGTGKHQKKMSRERTAMGRERNWHSNEERRYLSIPHKQL